MLEEGKKTYTAEPVIKTAYLTYICYISDTDIRRKPVTALKWLRIVTWSNAMQVFLYEPLLEMWHLGNFTWAGHLDIKENMNY